MNFGGLVQGHNGGGNAEMGFFTKPSILIDAKSEQTHVC